MKQYLRYITLLFLTLCLAKISSAQDEIEEPIHAVKVIGRAYKDSIKLRWAPASSVSWHYANKYGYKIERFLLVKDGQLLDNPVKRIMLSEPLKPAPLNEWEPFAETDYYVPVAAQAIFGESFEVSTNSGGDILQMINKSRELESRFSFALFSADISPKVAQLSGLVFVDESVKKGEKYLYKVIADVPSDVIAIDTGYVFIGVDDIKPLPQPREMKAVFSDKSVMLSWEHRFNDRYYIAYQVERSDDGTNFNLLDKLPMINTRKDAGVLQDLMFKLDSLPENNIEYFFRVRGINSFGEYGPYSDTVSGMGFELFAANPAITSSKVMMNQFVQLNWQFPDSLNYLIKGFEIQHATDDTGPFINLTDTLLSVTERTFTDQAIQTSNYYKVVAVDHGDEPHPSFPYMVLLIDSIPPDAPIRLNGNIDTLGVVTLNWDNNIEPDLLGYRVFRANHKSDEFSQITKDPINKNQFIDTINVKTLTRKVYYKILALDQHFNPSEFSDILELKRPDKIPPVQAVFTEVITNEGGIQLSWVCSSSDDVVKHVLYRKSEKSNLWNVIRVFEMSDSITSFNDTIATPGITYQYTLLAIDESGLESDPSIPVTMKAFERKIRPQVKDIKYKVDRDNKLIYINWEYPHNGVERFVIYRAVNDNPINLYTGVGKTIFEFEDKKLKPNNKYAYRIKVIYSDGTQSSFSEKFEVNY
jgi:fibronectin type 3 domain-containing protein